MGTTANPAVDRFAPGSPVGLRKTTTTIMTMASVVSLLAEELGGRGLVLEVGVGTGRIALPLARGNIPLAAVDLSRPMLDELLRKTSGVPPFPLVLADATTLPFPDGTFGAAYAAHVLHLIPAWRHAAAEMIRVVRPGGPVLIDLGTESGIAFEVKERFSRAMGKSSPHGGVHDAAVLDAAMAELGATVRPLPEIAEREERPLEDLIGAYEANRFSFTWDLDDATRHRAAEETRGWARRRYGSLDEPRTIEYPIVWRAYATR